MKFLLAALLIAYVPAIAEQSSVTLDGKAISVSWTPAAKGKASVWRVGDTFKTDADLVFRGVMMPKGEYALYVLPAADKWQLIISKQTGPKAYDPKLDVGRVNMALTTASVPAPASRLTLTKVAALAAKLEIASDSTVATTQFRLDRVGSNSEW